MQKDFLIDWLGSKTLQLCGPLMRLLPIHFILWIGRRLGEIVYVLDIKHRCLVYSNIKTAFEGQCEPYEVAGYTRNFYRSFGQHFIEILFIPLIDDAYFKKYINIRGMEYVQDGFRRGKGVIFLAMHSGDWELSNIICANLGFPFYLFIREQSFPRLNALLNSYRVQKGCRVITRQQQTRMLIEVLRSNASIGMTVDQGGKHGVVVSFCNKHASMSSGAVRLALRYGVAIIPVYFHRLKGPHIEVLVDSVFPLSSTGDAEGDIKDNLQRLMPIYERFIRTYPQEFLWSYKIWKYGRDARIAIVYDGKTGHLRQAESVAESIAALRRAQGGNASVSVVELHFRRTLWRVLSALCSWFFNARCQGCMKCARFFLTAQSYNACARIKPDFIISCGSSTSAVSLLLAQENQAKSVSIMTPPAYLPHRFDLVIVPRHDQPAQAEHVVVTDGALNQITDSYMQQAVASVQGQIKITKKIVVGILLGGNADSFMLTEHFSAQMVQESVRASDLLDAQIVLSTSRRTPVAAEAAVERLLLGHPRCAWLVNARTRNVPHAVAALLGLSNIVVVTPESISMISEAVASKKHVVVCLSAGLKQRHQRFIDYFVEQQYIHAVVPQKLCAEILRIWKEKPAIRWPDDRKKVEEALKSLF
jgi:lauroyl/myristoyl acyltransferase/mitochondrial fission protein ELM1